jgi:hypothetical protein
MHRTSERSGLVHGYRISCYCYVWFGINRMLNCIFTSLLLSIVSLAHDGTGTHRTCTAPFPPTTLYPRPPHMLTNPHPFTAPISLAHALRRSRLDLCFASIIQCIVPMRYLQAPCMAWECGWHSLTRTCNYCVCAMARKAECVLEAINSLVESGWASSTMASGSWRMEALSMKE